MRKSYATQTVQVRKQSKAYHFTITDIGGPAALAQWKADQIVAEAEWQKSQAAKREARRENAMGVVTGDLQAKPLTAVERAEVEYLRRKGMSKDVTAVVTYGKDHTYKLVRTPFYARAYRYVTSWLFKVLEDAFPQ